MLREHLANWYEEIKSTVFKIYILHQVVYVSIRELQR